MKNLVLGAIVGALIGALVGYVVWGQKIATLDARVAELESKLAAVPAPAPAVAPVAVVATAGHPRAATIVVTGAAGEQCTAKVDQPLIANKRNKRVVFIVDSEDAQCGVRAWRLQLHFLNIPASGGNPEIVYNATNNPLNIPADDLARRKLDPAANRGRFSYEVWYYEKHPQTGVVTTYKMLDPELEIEP